MPAPPRPRSRPGRSPSDALTGLDWGRTVRAVRVNGLETPWCHDDIIEVVSGAREALDVLIVPKARSARDVWWVDVLLTQLETKLGLPRPIGLEVLIEEAEGLANAAEIARASDRLEAIIFGAGDLSASLGARVDGNFDPVSEYPGDFWHFARVQVLAAARAAGIDAIDAPYPAYQDPEGYRSAAVHASLLGFDGKWAIHPDQIAIANEVFSPTPGEIEAARVAVETYRRAEPSGVGAIGHDGKLVDAAHMRLAANVLHKASLDGGPIVKPSRLRVVQWATGNIGARSLRAVIEHPALELVGLYVYVPDKVGRDAGELCGLGPTGVVASHDIDEMLAARSRLRAVHASQLRLRRGLPAAEWRRQHRHHERRVPSPAASRPGHPVEGRGRLRRAGRRSTARASSPGFITEAVPLVLTSIQRRLDSLMIEEYADLSQRNSPDLLFNLMGFRQPPAQFDERRTLLPAGQLRAVTRAGRRGPLHAPGRSGGQRRGGHGATQHHHRRRSPRGGNGGRAADDRLRHAVGPARDRVPGHLVLHGGSGSRLGRPTDRLACVRPGRRPVGGRPPLLGAARAHGCRLARLHRQPGRQRRALRLCRAPGITTTLDLPQIVADLG